MEHTEGKWEIHKEILNNPQPEYIYGGPNSTHICDFRRLNPCLLDEVLEQQQANARLIAAAPTLLEALNRIANECSEAMEGAGLPEFENYGCWMNIAKQAIAKTKNQ